MKQNNKLTLPVVTFEYPNSKNAGILRKRFVRVVRMDNVYIEGYEMYDFAEEDKYKRFSLNRIPHNGVALVKFNPTA